MDNVTWNTFSLVSGTSIIWTINGALTSECVSGLVVAGEMLLNVLNDEVYSFQATNNTAVELFNRSYPEDNFVSKDNIYGIGIPSDMITDDLYKVFPPAGMMGVIVYQYEDENGVEYWDLIKVKHLDQFMQGFISMCNAFEVDFKEYLAESPFDSNGTIYDLLDYNLDEYFVNEEEAYYNDEDEE